MSGLDAQVWLYGALKNPPAPGDPYFFVISSFFIGTHRTPFIFVWHSLAMLKPVLFHILLSVTSTESSVVFNSASVTALQTRGHPSLLLLSTTVEQSILPLLVSIYKI